MMASGFIGQPFALATNRCRAAGLTASVCAEDQAMPGVANRGKWVTPGRGGLVAEGQPLQFGAGRHGGIGVGAGAGTGAGIGFGAGAGAGWLAASPVCDRVGPERNRA